MDTKRILNFNAGPAALPLSVLKEIQSSFLNFNNCGMSITEISHQSMVINSITGINREDHKLYYPKELILNIDNLEIKGAIINLLNELN